MPDYISDFWEERYSSDGYVYGTEPNKFFKEQINKIQPPGRLILPGEGEGRNAVHAAKLGWQVDAFDQSRNAMNKALKLAEINKVHINYSITDLNKFLPSENTYDLAAIIFVHFKEELRASFHTKIINSLKPGAKLILELFSKKQFGKSSGGPQDISMLYAVEDIKNDFKNLKTILINEEKIFLDEGDKHKGEAIVIRYLGVKF